MAFSVLQVRHSSLLFHLDPKVVSGSSRIYVASYYAFRTLIPLPHTEPHGPGQRLLGFPPLPTLRFMAYLVRRRDTFLMRLLLVAGGIFLAIVPPTGAYLHQSPALMI